MGLPHFWEPEETVGTAWHDLAKGWDAEPAHEAAAVAYDETAPAAGLLHRAAGGAHGVEILGSAASAARSRVTGRAKLVREADHVTRASYDGRTLALPRNISLFADRHLNRDLYLWLASLAAFIETPFEPPEGSFACDIAMLRAAARAEARLLATWPGLQSRRDALAAAFLAQRPRVRLPATEAALESAIRALLAGATSQNAKGLTAVILAESFDPKVFPTPIGYKPFRPVALWPLLAPPRQDDTTKPDDDAQNATGAPQAGSDKTLRAKRHAADQADRRDSMILYRFESILSWVEFLNLNRATEDEEEGNAKRAANDLEEVSIAKVSRKAKKKLLFDLDLSPRDVDRETLVGETLYPEWDWKTGSYLPDHVRVEERVAEEKDATAFEGARTRRRIERVRRQFEALRPRRRIVKRQPDGFDLDFDEIVRAHCDLLASGEASDRLYTAIRDDERDLSVSVLVDVSRSTESAIAGRPVIEIAREALVALVSGLEACGDQVSVHAFSSLRRDRVMIERVKGFDEANDMTVRRRVMGLSPRYYTRMGAAIRHASRLLAAREAQRRLLLVITDGKPNDLDHYDGRHGVEDTRRAVQEARRLGQAVFAVTVDAKARDYIPYLFGPGGYAIVSEPEKLIDALPDMYRHVAG